MFGRMIQHIPLIFFLFSVILNETMFRLVKILSKLAGVVAVGILLFTVLMFGAKIWGVYSVPPTKEDPKGATLIISRNDDEPFLNAPDRPKPIVVEEPQPQSQLPGIYPRGPIKRRPVEKRIIVSLPFISWVHEEAVDTTGESQ